MAVKPVRVKIAGKLRTVPKSVVRRGHTKSWVKRQRRKYAKPKPTFNQYIKKQFLHGMKDSVFEPDKPKRRWNQK